MPVSKQARPLFCKDVCLMEIRTRLHISVQSVEIADFIIPFCKQEGGLLYSRLFTMPFFKTGETPVLEDADETSALPGNAEFITF